MEEESDVVGADTPLVEGISSDRSLTVQRGITAESLKRQLVATFGACLGPFSLGFVLGYSSPCLPQLIEEGWLTASEASWFGSLVNMGAILSGPVGGWAVGAIGRKSTVIISAVPYLTGWLLIIAAKHVWMFYLGRVLTGFASGISSLCVPLYIAEVSDQRIRGLLGASFQVGSTSGILAVYALGLVVRWQWLAVMAAVPPTLMCTIMLFMPETPRWLLAHGARPRAIKALKWLRGHDSEEMVLEECFEIEANLLNQTRKISILDFSSRVLYIPLLLSIAVMFFQQFSGINAVIFYTDSIFKSSGFGSSSGIPTVLVGAVQVFVTLLSIFVVDRAGRRALLMISGSGMCVSCITLGIYYYLSTHLHQPADINWLSLVSLLIYITFYSVGYGALPWVIMAEIFPLRARGLASGIATACNWTMSFIVTKEFNTLTEAISQYGVFWMFASICLAGVIFVKVLLPETKGRSLEDIEEQFQRQG